MKQTLKILAATLLMSTLSLPATAATRNCTFKKQLRQAELAFDIASRPAAGCAVQVIDITLRRSGKFVSRYRADVDYLAEKAWLEDLSGDGRPELVIASSSVDKEARGALDVYQIEKNSLRRASLPKLDDSGGYRGGDRFFLDERQIVRTFPLYRDGDAVNNPSGDSRTLKYDFGDGKISLRVKQENQATATEPASGTATVQEAQGKPAGTVISKVALDGTAIEISANALVNNFKIMKLEKPERIAIDIPGAASPLAGKKVKIDNFGISRARVGNNRGFLRIVLDSTRPAFPKYKVTRSDSGLKVVFEDK